MMDLNTCCDLFDNNVGKRVFVKIKESFTGKIRRYKGIIQTGFSQEPSPVSHIKTVKAVREIFLGEVITVEII